MKTVIILGSAPDAPDAKRFNLKNVTALVTLNNAWKIRDDWTHSIYPEDFPENRRPKPTATQKCIDHTQYVPANNAYGGIIYAGATMTFTAAYWALSALKPNLLLFHACDMIYNQNTQTHFYGRGSPDPLRNDPTLQSLEGKSNRLTILAARNECLTANLSRLSTSRLTMSRFDPSGLTSSTQDRIFKALQELKEKIDNTHVADALRLEKDVNIFWESGDYWNANFELNKKELFEIDKLWEKALINQQNSHITSWL